MICVVFVGIMVIATVVIVVIIMVVTVANCSIVVIYNRKTGKDHGNHYIMMGYI